MCGIAGIIGRDRKQVQAALERVVAAQTHRGPDSSGAEVHAFGRDWLGLGHRRLSILDLSTLGHQPMTHSPSGCTIVFNGEIYNYRRLRAELEAEGEVFRSGGDTEVLVAGMAQHGPDYLGRLEGMYAFALFDPRGPSLLLARDPVGIKPLYLAALPDRLVFASEVRAILASGLVERAVSRAGVAGLLAYGAVQQPLTVFESIRMLPAGAWQSIECSAGGFQVRPPQVWWRLPEPAAAGDGAQVVARTRQLLEEAVRDHLVSDVPVGVFLSAGLDSATIAGLAARHSGDVRTFTVGFGEEHADFDEVETAASTARRFGLRHTAIRIGNQAAEEAGRRWLADSDQPSMDGLNTFVISRAVREHGIKVALCGLGADELFGGYPTFTDVPRIVGPARRLAWLPPAGRRAIASLLSLGRSPVVRGKLGDMLAFCDSASLALQRRRLLNDRQLDALGLSAKSAGLTPLFLSPEAELPPADADPGWTISAVESRFYQTNMLLRDSDANGMAHSLEIRVPFLDQRLVAWMHGLPGPVRFPRHGPPKQLLRRSIQGLLPEDVLGRPKSGFVLPLRRWMIGPLRRVCEQGISALKQTGLVRETAVDGVWNAFLAAPETQVWTRALALASLGDYLLRHAG